MIDSQGNIQAPVARNASLAGLLPWHGSSPNRQETEPSLNATSQACLVALMGAAAILGIYIRFKGLGTWPIGSVDEYFIGKSVRRILEYGVPRLESGGYYLRGILHQYVSAALIWLGVPELYALRIFPVALNVVAMPAVYLLGRKISGQAVACVAVAVYAFSVWEVELARCVRMYAPFQACFVWYVLFLYRAVVEGDGRATKWMYSISLISLFVFEGSIFLMLLNFLPFIMIPQRTTARELLPKLCVPLVLLGLAVFFIKFDFYNLGVTDQLPPGLAARDKRPDVDHPVLLASVLPQCKAWLAGYAALAVAAGCGIWTAMRDRALDVRAKLAMGLLTLLCLANLYGMVACCGLLLLLIGWLRPVDARSSGARVLLLIGAASLLFWSAFLLSTTEWHTLFDNFQYEARFRKMLLALVDYPFIYDKVVDQFLSAIPFFTVTAAVLLGAGLIHVLVGKEANDQAGFRFLLFLVLFHVVLVGMLSTPYKSTRYSFFLFPLILLLVVASMKELSKRLAGPRWAGAAFAAGLGLWLMLSEDFDAHHLSHIDSKEVYYRFGLEANSDRADHYYRRFDFKNAAEAINRNRGKGDLVLSVFLLAPDYFLDRLDYVYRSNTLEQFHRSSRRSGTREAWTNKKLIHREHALYDLVERSEHTLWVVAYSDAAESSSVEEKRLAKLLAKQRFYTTEDGMINVYRVVPAKQYSKDGL